MPKSKRSKVVSLTKTEKKNREWKEGLFSKIRESIDTYDYVFSPWLHTSDRQVWVFSVENMRNTYLKDVRKAWDDSKVLFGRTKIMAKALGTTQEEEYQENLHKLAEVRSFKNALTAESPWGCGIITDVASSRSCNGMV